MWMLTLIFALGLPAWLLVEEVMRLKTARSTSNASAEAKPRVVHTPERMKVAYSRGA